MCLIENAVEAAGESTRAEITVRSTPAQDRSRDGERVVQIDVIDDGPGVPEPLARRIFDPFYTTKARGIGLGLSLAEKLVREKRRAHSVGVLAGPTHGVLGLPAGRAAMRRVVFVDDEETLVWSLLKQGQITRPDFVFDGFSDPVLAREAIKSNPPDVLVTDLRMPGLTGLDLLVAGRQASAQLPVIIVSAYGTPEVREEIKRQAEVQFIEKPATFQRLMEAVERAITPRTGFSGAIDLPLLPDIIQIYAIGQTTGMLRIHRGGERGEIYFDSGCITHATCGDAEGEAAFYRIMTWDGGAFSMETERAPPRAPSSLRGRSCCSRDAALPTKRRRGRQPGLCRQPSKVRRGRYGTACRLR